jgi:hypothetical protein
MTYWNGSAWEAERPATPPRPRRGQRFLGAVTEAGLITLLMFGLIAGTALAGGGGNGRGSGQSGGGDKGSLALVMLQDTNGDGLPNYSETVTFTVTTTATDKPYVSVRCYQDSAFVYDGWAGFFVGAWFGQTFTLSSTSWSSGGADCTARLVMWGNNGRERTLAQQSFRVEA